MQTGFVDMQPNGPAVCLVGVSRRRVSATARWLPSLECF